jgi:hypothetical protein
VQSDGRVALTPTTWVLNSDTDVEEVSGFESRNRVEVRDLRRTTMLDHMELRERMTREDQT